MKVKQAALSLLVVAILLASCAVPENKVVASLGKYDHHVFFTSGGFQDFTDYAKYTYSTPKLSGNAYLKQIRETDLAAIHTHLDDFEGWIETIRSSDASNEVVVHYDFDRKIIDTEDYIYIDSEEHTWSDGHTSLVKYSIYFFDVQTYVLYYFHSNI